MGVAIDMTDTNKLHGGVDLLAKAMRQVFSEWMEGTEGSPSGERRDGQLDQANEADPSSARSPTMAPG